MAAAGGDGGGNIGPGPCPESPPGEEEAVAAAPPDRPAAPAGPEPRRKRRRVRGHGAPAGSGWRRLPLPPWRSVPPQPSGAPARCSPCYIAQAVPGAPQPSGAGPGSRWPRINSVPLELPQQSPV